MRILGVASATAALALGAAGNALACNIRDFSAVAACDDNGKGTITVTDVDASGVVATVSVYLESNGSDAKKVGEETVKGTKQGATVTFSEDWAPKAQYRIHIKAGNQVDEDISPNLTAPSEACTSEETETPKPSETPQPSDTPSSSATPSEAQPSAPESESTAPAGSTGSTGDNSPSPAVGDSNLAETGASSNTGMIAGIAGAFVVVGGGAVYFGMRRRGASKTG
ncbi:LAETG motif-containing sortase-dependent surface protein [Streptomyces sp. NPDC059785]|uniref:LAETG motif-containing sortase-dependent surface protein n=1 Tax=unclassified Streptomyces TaxID=2593676 RepID=UPI0036680076